MATRETRAQRGTRLGRRIELRLLDEIRSTRMAANVSARSLARELGWSHSRYVRFENGTNGAVPVTDVAAAGAVVGLDLSCDFHSAGVSLRDKGQLALATRMRTITSPAFRVTAEVLLPNPGDRRSWDLLLRREHELIGVELETRIRDLQQLVRRIRERERDGGVDHVLLVLSASAHNRALLPQLLEALGPSFATPPHAILGALRMGRPIPGSGVLLL